MKTYIALLRGINVSGQKKIVMADLRIYMVGLGFQGVETYIQSGNIIFKSSLDSKKEIENQIQGMIRKKYGFDVPVLVKRLKDIEYVLRRCPFPKDAAKDVKRVFVTFLSGEPVAKYVAKLSETDHEPDEFVVDKDNLYGYFPLGMGKSRLNNNFIEAKLKISATTRNWNTVNKLAEMARAST